MKQKMAAAQKVLDNIAASCSPEPEETPAPKQLDGDTFTWTVQFTVTKNWVEDGFDLTQEVAEQMIETLLSYSHEFETAARIIEAPDPKLIRKTSKW